MDELAEMLASVLTQLKWVTELSRFCTELPFSTLIDYISLWACGLQTKLQIFCDTICICTVFRVNSVIGMGVGAGAYILSRFAVSFSDIYPENGLYFWNRSTV